MKPPTVFLGEMTDPEVEAFLRDHDTVIVPVGSTEQHGPHGPLLTDVLVPVEVARRVAPRAGALVAPSINYGLSYPHAGFTGVVHLRIATFMALVEDVAVGLATMGFRRIVFLNGHYDNTLAIAYACANAADRLPAGARAFPVNYWDGMTADEAAEYFGPTAGLHANRAETSAVMAIDPALVDMDRANAEMPPFPEVTQPRRGPHRVLLLDARIGPSRDRERHVGRRPRVQRRVRRALPRGRDRSHDAHARRRRADVRGDAAPLTGGDIQDQPASAANHVPARMTRRTARSEPSSTRSARWPTAIRPRSTIPSMASGLRLAAATAAGSGTPDATTSATAVSSASTDPARVRVPASVTRCPATTTSRPPRRPRPSPIPASATASLTSSSRSDRLQARDERPQRRIDVDAIGDQLDEHRVVEQGGDGHARRMVVDPAHRVEQVRRRAGARCVAGLRLLEGRRPNDRRGRHATVREPSDEFGGAGQLRRHRHQPESVEERLQRRARDLGRDLQVGRVVGAPTGPREERSLQVEAQRLGAVGGGVRRPFTHRSGEVDERGQRRGHGGGQERGHAATQQAAGHPVERGPPAHRVVAAPAVDVDVDEAGADERAVGRPRRPSSIAAISPASIVILPACDPVVEDETSGDRRRARRSSIDPGHGAASRRIAVRSLDVEMDASP